MLVDFCGGAEDFALLQELGVRLAFLIRRSLILDLIDGNDGGLVTFFGDGERASILRESHRSNALGALNARVSLLVLLLKMVDDNVVTNWVDNLVVVEEKDVVSDVCLKSRDELGSEGDSQGFFLGLGARCHGLGLLPLPGSRCSVNR